jgi:hypothetical protein
MMVELHNQIGGKEEVGGGRWHQQLITQQATRDKRCTAENSKIVISLSQVQRERREKKEERRVETIVLTFHCFSRDSCWKI